MSGKPDVNIRQHEYGAKGHQGTGSASGVSLEWHCQPGVVSSAVPDCAVDEIISNMFHWGTSFRHGHRKALSQTGGDERKSATPTARGEEVVKKAVRSVTSGRPWGEADDGRMGSPQRSGFHFSRGSSQPRDSTQVSRIAGRFFTG